MRGVTRDAIRLVPATVELARAEIGDRAAFARGLDAVVPENWPPEMVADALSFFLDLLERNPGWEGWLGWYAVAGETLVGSVGFKGPPDEEATVEIGYSVLPQFQGKGYATEMAAALIARAAATGQVRRVVAQTTEENAPSRRVLAKLGFVSTGPGSDPDSTLFALLLDSR
jgi:RimJ/RimL family protein N-acetyltransferase